MGYLKRRKLEVVKYLPPNLHQVKIISFVLPDFQETLISILEKMRQDTEINGKYENLPKLFYKHNITLISQMKSECVGISLIFSLVNIEKLSF